MARCDCDHEGETTVPKKATSSRRQFLRALGGAAAATAVAGPLWRALAQAAPAQDEFFVFIHASGGWDVTLWSDPRNERVGLVEPATTATVDITGLKHWTNRSLEGGGQTFELVRPPGSEHAFGPSIGDLYDLHDRLCVVNGIAMNTVSHPDGAAYSLTGRHLAGGKVAASSIDTMVANELGRTQLFPTVAVGFNSSHVGSDLDPRVVPMRIDSIARLERTLRRATAYTSSDDRSAVTAMLSQEAADLAARSARPEKLRGLELHYGSLQNMLSGDLTAAFNAALLRQTYPDFNYTGTFQGARAVNAAFAAEAMKNNLVRCVSFSLTGLDTHNTNYRNHARNLQEVFDVVATLVRTFDQTPHPTRVGAMLSDHAHIVVLSEFCRTPRINLSQGRDHYPNNSALIVSPRFRGGFRFGGTDAEQLLPVDSGTFSNGTRAITPPDVLATVLGSVGIEPRRYLRDGETVGQLLRS